MRSINPSAAAAGRLLTAALAFALLWAGPAPALDQAPENIALRAKASADSEYDASYSPRFAIDGKIPSPGAQNDSRQAWCVRGDTHRQRARFVLEWAQPVPVAEVVVYGRTGWYAEECWKDCEIFLDGQTAPEVRRQLLRGHGPQRIRLPAPRAARSLVLQFTSSYGGLNPGASEIQVYSTPPSDGALGPFVELPPGRPDPGQFETLAESPGLKKQVFEGGCGFDKLLVIQRRELNPSHVYTYHVEGFEPGGGLFVASLASGGTASLRPLALSPEGQILDCDLSPDGREALFSWRRRKQDGYHVFCVNTDGSGLRQLSDGPWHDYNACWLPDGAIAFLTTRSSRFAYCWISPVGLLHRMDRDGSHTRRLSANIVNDFTPSVLHDGRVIYSRWEYVDKPAIPVQSLWTIHPDGTGLAGYFGNRVLSPATFMEARSVPGSGKVLCILTSHNGPARGAVGLIDISRGNNAQESIENLTPEVAIGRVDKGDGNAIRGPYENPWPLDNQRFLVSKRGTILIRDYPGTEQARILAPRDGLGFYSPQPLRPRPVPPQLASNLTNNFAEDETAVEWAVVVLEDVYRGLEPAVKRGEIKEICVVEEMRKAVRTDVNNRAFGFQFPVISCGATYACKTVWGYAPVAPDGSACFQVPARRPVYFMALDAQGRALQRMRTFTHLMPGERQGCAGCHEPRQQSTTPRHPAALARKPDPLRPPEWGAPAGFDYNAVVQPVLDRHCASCHTGPSPKGGVDLSDDKTDYFNVSYETLARGRRRSGEAEWDNPYTSWIPTYNGMEQNILEVTPKAWGSPRSKLAALLLARHPDTNGLPRLDLTAADTRRLLAWIDLNVPYYGTSETAYPEKQGCRRLYPQGFDKLLAGVAARRCAGCHDKGSIPRPFWTRVTHPELNTFLRAPLAPAAGGSGKCGRAVFESPADPDYQALLGAFTPVLEELKRRPRMDMPGARPAAVDRSCLGSL